MVLSLNPTLFLQQSNCPQMPLLLTISNTYNKGLHSNFRNAWNIQDIQYGACCEGQEWQRGGFGMDHSHPIPAPDYTVISHPRHKLMSGQVDWFPSPLTKKLITLSPPRPECPLALTLTRDKQILYPNAFSFH